MADNDLARTLALVDQLQPALERNDRAALNGIVEQLVALRAPMGGQWQQLAYIAAGNGELALARQAMDLLVAEARGRPTVRFQTASAFALLGLWRDAEAALQTIGENVPDTATAAFSRGTTALNVGKPEEARRYLERFVRMRPQSGYGWHALAMAADLSREPELADRLIAAEPGFANVATEECAPYFYALGKLRDARGEHKLAFEAFARGAQHMKSIVAYDRAADLAAAEQAIAGYSAERIAAIAGRQREPTGRTIFVTGLPRSGTTLVEQILTSHSAVSDGGEIARLLLLTDEIGGASHAALARHVEAHGVAPATQLWHHWLDELFPGSGRIVDKTVDASRSLGLAAALLPEAPLIWMTRDPLDRAWSCFRTNFSASAMPWSYDLEDIAAHFRIEDGLLAQWQAILGERLLVLPYEALVTDPGTWIRRILAHCGLSEEPAVFAPHENARPVATSSMMQVRRPINRDGMGAAEPYREFLGPFIAAYEG